MSTRGEEVFGARRSGSRDWGRGSGWSVRAWSVGVPTRRNFACLDSGEVGSSWSEGRRTEGRRKADGDYLINTVPGLIGKGLQQGQVSVEKVI